MWDLGTGPSCEVKPPAPAATAQLGRKRSRAAEEVAEEPACPPKTRQRRQQEDAALTGASETLALFGALLGTSQLCMRVMPWLSHSIVGHVESLQSFTWHF